MVDGYFERGWVRFPYSPAVADWVAHALPAARAAVQSPDLAQWHVCEGTWFVGVDALDNDRQGRVGGSPPLSGAPVDFIRRITGDWPDLHRAQVSVVYPGYPRPRAGETDAAFRYRLVRDAAHVDGLKPVGTQRRRHLQEHHAFILGLPLSDASADAAPLVVWEGSHEVIRAAFRSVLDQYDPAEWPEVDLTETYHQARRKVFDTCVRRPVPARPGEAYLVHRLALHGVAPWDRNATAGEDGRMIAYFRPVAPWSLSDWLNKP